MEGPNPIDLTKGEFYMTMTSLLPHLSEDVKRRWPSLIVIANVVELRQAKEAGWITSEIVLPTMKSLKDRRWRRIVLTWAFVTDPANERMIELIHSDQVIYDLPVRISDVMNEERIWQ